MLPLLPFVCLLAAVAVVSGVSLLRRFDIPRWARTALIAGLTIAALLPPAIGAVRFNIDASRKWTYGFAYEWILANVPAGSHLALEGVGLRLPDAHYRLRYMRMLTDLDYDAHTAKGVQYFVASWQSFGRSLSAPELHPVEYARLPPAVRPGSVAGHDQDRTARPRAGDPYLPHRSSAAGGPDLRERPAGRADCTGRADGPEAVIEPAKEAP